MPDDLLEYFLAKPDFLRDLKDAKYDARKKEQPPLPFLMLDYLRIIMYCRLDRFMSFDLTDPETRIKVFYIRSTLACFNHFITTLEIAYVNAVDEWCKNKLVKHKDQKVFTCQECLVRMWHEWLDNKPDPFSTIYRPNTDKLTIFKTVSNQAKAIQNQLDSRPDGAMTPELMKQWGQIDKALRRLLLTDTNDKLGRKMESKINVRKIAIDASHGMEDAIMVDADDYAGTGNMTE